MSSIPPARPVCRAARGRAGWWRTGPPSTALAARLATGCPQAGGGAGADSGGGGGAEPPLRTDPRAEPRWTEPAQARPPRVEPAQAEPARAEPPRTEPPRTEPAQAEPVRAAAAPGALVVGVGPGPAAAAGVRPGDVIIQFGDRRVGTVADLLGALQSAEPSRPVLLVVRRGGANLPLLLRVGEGPA